jgi:predicted amidohydrolase YtcJ
MAILDRDPLAIDSTTIKDIKAIETIKEGKTIFCAQ